MLKRLEWAGCKEGPGSGFMDSGPGTQYPACPICGGIDPRSKGWIDFRKEAIGHTSYCSLRRLIKEIGV
jgi:hypothetical protein